MNGINLIGDFCRERDIDFTLEAPLSERCTFKTGGRAAILIEPSSAEEISALAVYMRKAGVRYIVLGRGSNVLFPDGGLDCAVILLGERYSKISLDGVEVFCQSGVSLSRLCRFALENSLSGLEFAYGIPGTAGGAVYMNAGAYGGEIKDVLVSAEHIGADGKPGAFAGKELGFAYRKSSYTGTDMIITGARFRLKRGDKDYIGSRMEEYIGRRRDKQPLDYPSAGSSFKRPDGAYASELIDKCGLKGFFTGGAGVSEKHAGFIINRGGASSADILAVIRHVRDTVKDKTGFLLEPEIKIYNMDGRGQKV